MFYRGFEMYVPGPWLCVSTFAWCPYSEAMFHIAETTAMCMIMESLTSDTSIPALHARSVLRASRLLILATIAYCAASGMNHPLLVLLPQWEAYTTIRT